MYRVVQGKEECTAQEERMEDYKLPERATQCRPLRKRIGLVSDQTWNEPQKPKS
jgi:hypothetical protein